MFSHVEGGRILASILRDGMAGCDTANAGCAQVGNGTGEGVVDAKTVES